MSSTGPSILTVLAQELAWVKQSRTARLGGQPLSPTDKNLIGLCFSGGGIRSATFNLGVLQGLAQSGLLRKIDYISTVSGGGYIGSWLLGWMHHQDIGSKKIEEVLSSHPNSAGVNAEPAEIRFLRNYSNYLTPRTGALSSDFWTLIAIYLRNMFLNILILSLVFLTAILLPRAILWLVHGLEVLEVLSCHYFAEAIRAQWIATGLGLFFGFIATIFIGWNITWLEPPPESGDANAKQKRYAQPLYVHLLIIFPLCLAAILLSFAAIFIYAYYPLGWEDTIFAPLVERLIGVSGWILGHLHTTWHTWFLGPLLGCAILVSQWTVACLFRWGVLIKNAINHTALPADGPSPWEVIGHSVLAGLLAGTLLIPFTRLLTLGQLVAGGPGNKWMVLIYAPPVMIGIILVAGTLHIGLLGRAMRDSHREWWARLGAYLFLAAMTWLILFWVAIDFPPLLGYYVAGQHHTWTYAGVLTWIVSTAYGVLFGKSDKTSHLIPDLPFKQKIPGYLAKITPYIFILGLLLGFSLLAASLDNYFLGNGWEICTFPKDTEFRPRATLLMLFCFGAALYLSWRVDVNQFSIHNLYRNRLVRCYLGASVPNRVYQPWTAFSKQDDFPLDELHPLNPAATDGRPFPILNTTLNVVRGQELALQMRKARAFILTPLFSGFTWPGKDAQNLQSIFAQTCEAGPRVRNDLGETTLAMMGSRVAPLAQPDRMERSGLTIGTAMAISGAAASPNMGHYSDAGIGFLMTVFDVRLGWWMGNPMHKKSWIEGSPKFGFQWMITELLGLTTDQSKFVYLSDGGHFENLGLYELVRRRCRLIIASDAGQDSSYLCGDLRAAIERCRVDFGVEIEIDLSCFLPQSAPPRPAQHFTYGKIHYPPSDAPDHLGPREGVLILFKPNVVPGDPVDVAGYSKTNPHFPNDTTVNQWYDEAHFENYRALGQATAKTASTAIEGVVTGILV
jgi:Patatin-like phospholipase